MTAPVDVQAALEFAGADINAAPGSVQHSLALVAQQYAEMAATMTPLEGQTTTPSGAKDLLSFSMSAQARTAVAALIARNAELEAHDACLQSGILLLKQERDDLTARNDALATDNKALRENVERYRWLRAQLEVTRNAAVPIRIGMDYLLTDEIASDYAPDDDERFIDAVIDSARAEVANG